MIADTSWVKCTCRQNKFPHLEVHGEFLVIDKIFQNLFRVPEDTCDEQEATLLRVPLNSYKKQNFVRPGDSFSYMRGTPFAALGGMGRSKNPQYSITIGKETLRDYLKGQGITAVVQRRAGGRKRKFDAVSQGNLELELCLHRAWL